jgi:hypothetical protein
MASELKMASAFFLGRRSPSSSSLASGLPTKKPRIEAYSLPVPLVGALAAFLAVS